MNKKLLYFLAFLGAIFAYYLLQAVWGGISSTANPSAQVQRAQCLASCRDNKLSDNCDNYCLQRSLDR